MPPFIEQGFDTEVIVVGAGIGGLATARDLADAGVNSVVLEARQRIGGRAEYRQFPGSDVHVEMGGTWVAPRFHPHMMAEVERYALTLVTEHEAEWRWAVGTSDFTPAFPIKGDDLYDLERLLAEMVIAARRIDTSRRRDEAGDLGDLDVTIADWVRARNVSPMVEEFVFMFASLGMGATENEWSMLDALSLMAGMQCSPLGWVAAAGAKILGGTSLLMSKLAETPGVDLRLNSPVLAIRQYDEGVEVRTADDALYARHVVLATPVNTWADIDFTPKLNEAKQDLVQRRHLGRMTKLWLHVDEAPENLFAVGRDSEFLCVSTQYKTDRGYLLVAFASPPRTITADDPRWVARGLAQVLPDAQLLGYIHHDWAADEYSKGTWMGYPPGVLSTSATAVAASEHRLHIVGSDVARTWIGWFEGALETAHEVSSAILANSLTDSAH